jgi:uncharacterized protein (TIGR02271 family)
MQMTSAYEFVGRTVLDRDGEKLGTVKEIYDDQQTGQPEWATVAGGLFGLKSHFVPLAGASPSGEDVCLPVTKSQVQEAPSVDPDGALSEREEQTLFEHYGVPYTTEGTTTAQGRPATGASGRDDEAGMSGSGASERGASGAEDAMTRSEEELAVGTVKRERGRARLRKYVVTEQVETTVPVQREEVRVEREPITEANREAAHSGPDIAEAEHEVVLHEEEPVVEKRVVPKERVRLSKDTEVDEHAVSEEVRKERVDFEGDS